MHSKETQALMEAAVDAVIVIDHEGLISAVNQAAQRLFGFTPEELLGHNVCMLMPEPDRAAHDGYLRNYRESGQARIIGIGRQVAARRKDGSLFQAWLSVGRVPDSEPPRFVGMVRDLTTELEATAAQRVAQDRLTRVARLASMGEMATGVAHELNQPLTAITTYARACERFLAMSEPDFDELKEAVREIGAEGLRAGRIIDRLRQLVRSDEPAPLVPLDVNGVIEDLRALLTADALAFDAQLEWSLAPSLPRVRGDAVQLQQVILNLVRNAFEALGEKPAGQRHVCVRTAVAESGEVELTVSDDGPGFPAELNGRLFHPFATTKKSGTGLGLAMSRTLVHAHGGRIGAAAVSSGAHVFVRLPALEGNA